MTKVASVGGLLLAVSLAVSACGNKAAVPTGASPSMSETPSISASASPSDSASPSASPSASGSASASASAACKANIRVEARPMSAAAGHVGLVLVFNNVGNAPCRMFGYPGVDLVTSSGGVVARAARTLHGYMGGAPEGATAPQPVTLAPAASASAVLEGSDVSQNGVSNCGSYSLRITPPEQTVSVSGGTAKLPRCGLQIHPVVAGVQSLG